MHGLSVAVRRAAFLYERARQSAKGALLTVCILWDTVVMFELRQSLIFHEWMGGLRDARARERIAQRLARVAAGLLGDVKSVGSSIMELRIDYGPGYRIYFTRRGAILILLLCGGDKSTQRRDIEKAKQLADAWED